MKALLIKLGVGFVALSIIMHLASHGSGLAITSPAQAVVAAAPKLAPASTPAPAPQISGTPSTSDLWARAFLKLAGYRRTPCNKGAVEAWIRAEGSNPHWKNLLDDTYDGPGGSWERNGRVVQTVNSAGVRAYRKWIYGLDAAVHTLRYHPAIEKALKAGDDAQAVADAVQVPSTSGHMWGTAPFQATCTTG